MGEVQKKKKVVEVQVQTIQVEIPDEPPKGYGHDASHKLTKKEAAYLQECWDKERPERQAAIVQATAHLNPAEA